MKIKNLSITDLFDTTNKPISIQSVIDKLQELMKEGYTTAYVENDLVMYDPETEVAEYEEYITFYKD